MFNTSILLFFCFCSPLVTVFYSLYFSTKYIVDMQNWRKFYHARHDQPELLVGAVKLLLLASIWPQVNVTVFLLARGTWEDGTFYTSSALTLANAILLLAYRLSNYSLFHQLFPFCEPSDSDSFPLLSLKEQEERGPTMTYTDPVPLCTSWELSYCSPLRSCCWRVSPMRRGTCSSTLVMASTSSRSWRCSSCSEG